MKIVNFSFVAFASLFLPALTADALTIDTETIKDARKFGINFPDGTSFYGNTNGVTSISRQEFIVGPLLVTEVSIDIAGSPTQVRIYHSRTIPADKVYDMQEGKLPEKLKPYAKVPDSIKAQIKKGEEKLENINVQKTVYKDYPATTHSRTLEFVVSDLEELETFYKRITADFIDKRTEDVPQPDVLRGLGKKIYIIKDKESKK